MQNIELTEEERPIVDFFHENDMIKNGQFPVCDKTDSNTVCVSKFGGRVPLLPNEEIPKCSCGKEKELLMQIYAPQLPENIREILPSKLHQSLICLYYCTECMESDEHLETRIYNAEDLENLSYGNEVADAKIESSVFTKFEELPTFDDSSNKYMEFDDDDVDSLKVEELMYRLRHEVFEGRASFFGGFPHYEQGEVVPEGDFTFFANLEQDNSFSMMWGDAGSAQIWVNTEGEFVLGWQCG